MREQAGLGQHSAYGKHRKQRAVVGDMRPVVRSVGGDKGDAQKFVDPEVGVEQIFKEWSRPIERP